MSGLGLGSDRLFGRNVRVRVRVGMSSVGPKRSNLEEATASGRGKPGIRMVRGRGYLEGEGEKGEMGNWGRQGRDGWPRWLQGMVQRGIEGVLRGH